MKSLAKQALDRVGKNWSAASATREAKIQAITRFCKFVEQRFGLENVQNLKPGHVNAYVEQLHADNINPRTGANYMAYVRDIAIAIGKANIVSRDNAAYGFGGVTRQNPLTQNTGKVGEIRQQLEVKAAGGDRLAMMMTASAAMRDAFGLRQKEALMSCKIIYIDGKPHLDVEGAKTGKERQNEVWTDAQRAALVKVAETARLLGNANGRPIPPEFNLKQALQLETKAWHRAGGTREASANMHAARHEYAQQRLAEGASKAQVNRELGHGDSRSLGCYAAK